MVDCCDEDGVQLYQFWFNTEDVHAICAALNETGGSYDRALSEDILSDWAEQAREQTRLSQLP